MPGSRRGRSMTTAATGTWSGSLGGALVATLLGQQGQLLVGGLFLLEGLEDQRQRVLVAELLGERGQGAVGGDLVVLDLLRATDQGGVTQRAGFDRIDHFLAFLDQAFHRRAP